MSFRTSDQQRRKPASEVVDIEEIVDRLREEGRSPHAVGEISRIETALTRMQSRFDLDVNKYSVWTGNWSQPCPTCRIIRPIRSKHCPKCKHCVDQFDDHCQWISNCVGKKNKRDFFIFICIGMLTSFLGGVLAIQRLLGALILLRTGQSWINYVFTEHPGIAVFLFLDGMLFIAALKLTTAQIAQNITTNELANHIRYGYLRGPDGRFLNPYNYGCRKNCGDFLISGYTSDEEITWPSLQQIR